MKPSIACHHENKYFQLTIDAAAAAVVCRRDVIKTGNAKRNARRKREIKCII